MAMIVNTTKEKKYLARYQWPKHYAIGSRTAICRRDSVICLIVKSLNYEKIEEIYVRHKSIPF